MFKNERKLNLTILALTLSFNIFFGIYLTVFAFNTKRDFSSMGKMLFITLIVIVVAGLLNLFFQSAILATIISAVGAILFSAYILYDTQMILRGGYDSPVLAAVSLYLDILNLFISLLNLLGIFNRD